MQVTPLCTCFLPGIPACLSLPALTGPRAHITTQCGGVAGSASRRYGRTGEHYCSLYE